MSPRKTYVNPEFLVEQQSFFSGKQLSAAGSLRSAGVGRSLRNSNWLDTRPFYSFPYYTFNMMLEDSCGTYHNERGFQCHLDYGDFFFTFPHIKHLYGPGEDDYWNELFINYSGAVFDVYYQQKYFSPEQPVWHLPNPAPWIERIMCLVQRDRPSSEIAIAAETSQFLALLFGMLEDAIPKGQDNSQSDWFDRACLMLVSNMQQVDLVQIAHELGMSYPSFRRHFTRRAGMPPYQYRDQKRIEHACQILKENPSKLCKEIAFSLGFARGDHFARQFKKHTGLLPREYQKLQREKC